MNVRYSDWIWSEEHQRYYCGVYDGNSDSLIEYLWEGQHQPTPATQRTEQDSHQKRRQKQQLQRFEGSPLYNQVRERACHSSEAEQRWHKEEEWNGPRLHSPNRPLESTKATTTATTVAESRVTSTSSGLTAVSSQKAVKQCHEVFARRETQGMSRNLQRDFETQKSRFMIWEATFDINKINKIMGDVLASMLKRLELIINKTGDMTGIENDNIPEVGHKESLLLFDMDDKSPDDEWTPGHEKDTRDSAIIAIDRIISRLYRLSARFEYTSLDQSAQATLIEEGNGIVEGFPAANSISNVHGVDIIVPSEWTWSPNDLNHYRWRVTDNGQVEYQWESNIGNNLAACDTECETESSQTPPQSPRRRFIRTGNDARDEECLDPHYYKQVQSSSHREFFVRGRVFKMLWSEAAGQVRPGGTRGSTHFSVESFGGNAYSEIRRFIVVRNKETFSQCLPIQTYRRQGACKPGLVSQDHAIIYTSSSPNVPFPDEETTRRALRVDPIPGQSLEAQSCIRFGKPWIIEHDLKLQEIGLIAQEHLHLLGEYYREAMGSDSEDENVESGGWVLDRHKHPDGIAPRWVSTSESM
ncbi:hypothetical protein BDV96DRAFT_588747 [Lophiotrema nucula]|uniref:DUF6590 domain-containing protein n=1 Tax=Lophiotrema nucula TaxID=690887 RepID=A0A6A5YLD3_9PLEO|nr:hypothetical protein BDV96DRAFT_588747 [Lophiotrema nucula]